MLKSLSNKFANFTAVFHDRGTEAAGKLAGFFRLKQFLFWLGRRLSKPAALVGIESFVALSLAVYFFFLMFPQLEAPRAYDGNEMNSYLFTYLSDHPYAAHKDMLAGFDNWKPRLPGPMISGWMNDQALKYAKISEADTSEKSNMVVFGGYITTIPTIIFGSYHAAWLLLLFVVLILHRKDALLLMLGIFSGLMYNFIFPAGAWFYPWDMPALFFFTWACLLYDKRQFFPLMLVVWLGGLFKETALCCTLLILLGEHWTLKKRITGFAVTIIACLIARKLLMSVYEVKTMFFSLSNANGIHDFVFHSWFILMGNTHQLFSLNLNHVLFTNAGALFVMMLIPWRTHRDVVFKVVVMVFIIGQFLCGSITEFRIWYEILPLGWMVISEALASRYPIVLLGPVVPGGGQTNVVASDQSTRVMRGSYWLTLIFYGVVLFGIFPALGLVLILLKHQ